MEGGSVYFEMRGRGWGGDGGDREGGDREGIEEGD